MKLAIFLMSFFAAGRSHGALTYDDPWPPYAQDQCPSASVAKELTYQTENFVMSTTFNSVNAGERLKNLLTFVFVVFFNFFLAPSAHAQSTPNDVYFTSGWCPRPDELASISKQLSLTMNGCCILKGSPPSSLNVSTDALSPWKSRIVKNFYPQAKCDGVVMTVEEERIASEVDANRATKVLEATRLQNKKDGKLGLWPPNSIDSCLNAAASNYLDKRGISIQECYELSKSTSSENARNGGYFVQDFGLWNVNSAGGVEPHGEFVNPRIDAEIKYIHLQIAMYNAVGDQLKSEIGGYANASILVTGPIANKDGAKSSQWDPVWYNHSAACLKIVSVRVDFINQKTINFSGPVLFKALHPKLLNQCGVRRKN